MKRSYGCYCVVVILLASGQAVAVPPLGLTQIDLGGGLEIIDGAAYVSGKTGVQSISSAGVLDFIAVSHPMFDTTDSVTRVVKGLDGELYVAANLSHSSQFPFGAALYRLDQPSTPIVSWEAYGVQGVARDLTVIGTVEGDSFSFVGSKFLVDGTIEPLAFPPGEDCFCYTLLIGSTPNGFAIGEAGIPMTIGSGPVMWTPDGGVSFFTPFQFGDADSIRDRNGADVPNIGWNDFNTPKVSYGDGRNFTIFKEDGSLFYDDFPPESFRVIVSHGDFAVVKVIEDLSPEVSTLYGFYPGIVPGFDNRGLPLLDIFPELATVDIDLINSLASVDGFLYMTLSGADGTYLFGARDPSVVPEPAAFWLAILGIVAACRKSLFPTFAPPPSGTA